MSNKTNSRLTGVLLQEWNILNIENIRHCLQNLALTSPEFKTFTQSWPLGSRPVWKAKSSWPSWPWSLKTLNNYYFYLNLPTHFWTNQYVLCATVSILAKPLNLSQNGKCFIGHLEKSPWTCDDFALWGNLIQLGYWKIWHITLYYHSFVFADFTNVSRVTTLQLDKLPTYLDWNPSFFPMYLHREAIEKNHFEQMSLCEDKVLDYGARIQCNFKFCMPFNFFCYYRNFCRNLRAFVAIFLRQNIRVFCM